MTNATYTQPASVDTYVKSATHNLLGASGLKSRLTRSWALVAAGSGTVVRFTGPRRAPCSPRVVISRSTVHRATSIPLPRSSNHILRGDRFYGSPLRRMLRPDLLDQPHSTFSQLLRVAPRSP